MKNPSLAGLSASEKRALLARELLRTSRAVGRRPLSHGQKALWFLRQSAPDSAAYHVAFAARVRSPLQVPAFGRALQALIDRHPALRTTYALHEGEPVQTTHAWQEVCLEAVDAGGWSEDELRTRVADAYRRPFDLEQGPVLRAHLFRRAIDEHVLLLVIHHIAVDAWSLWTLQNELRQLYAAESAGTRALLPPLERSYADHVRIEDDMLAGERGAELWRFWQHALDGAPQLLDLPTSRPRPAVQSYRGGSHAFRLDRELSQRLKALARAEQVTPFMLLLAMFQVLLHRYSGQDDFLIGSPTAGRSRADFAGVVGYFVNPLVLRAQLGADPTFRAFLAATRRTVLDAMAHQDYPFPLLVKRLHPKRDASHAPLFQVSFVLQQAQRAGAIDWTPGDTHTRIDWAGLELELYDMPQQEGQFELELEMMEAGGAFHGTFKYNSDLYDNDAASRMAGHLRTLAEAIAADPQHQVSDLPLLTAAERVRLAQCNATRVDYDLDVPLHRLCEAQSERTPERVAVVYEGRQLTYRDLHARANRLAHTLRGFGVGPDVPVGICAERSLEMVVGLLGILKAGGFYVPLDPGYPADRLAFMLEDSGVPVLLTQQHLAAVVGASPARLLCLDADWDDIARQPDTSPDSGAGPDTLAYMIYTSGSTGRPKGALNTHRNVVNRLLWMQDEYRLSGADAVLQKTPFSFDVSVWEFFWPLITGARMVLAKPEGHRDNAYLAELIADHGITTLHFVPPMLQLFVEEPSAARCGSLKRVICSGEALPFELQQSFFARFDAELHNLYGPTECAIDVTHWACQRESTRPIVPIGRPIANTQIHVLDRKLQPVPVGIPGELHIGGTNVGRGYHRRPELTAQTFIRDPFLPGMRLYKSGDLARWLDDGSIEYLGRLDHQVKIRGFRIELDEIRAVLDRHPGVRESIVVVREEPQRERRLAAYFVAADNNVSTDSLRAYLKEKLPEFMVPSFLVPLAALPLSPNGKIDRQALPAPTTVRRTLAQRPPRDEAERRLVGIWEQVLGVHPVSIEDNFFDLGGDSLMAVKLMALVSEGFARRLPLPTLFQHPTVEQMAAHLGERVDARWDPLVEVQPGAAGTPPLFCMPGGGGNVLYFYRLARALGVEQPFYALQSVGLDGVTDPYTRVEDMAARYVQSIRGVQPHGPYRLAGHCFGALVAFETAQQLKQQGETVALVAILDSPAPVADQPATADLDDAEWLLRIAAAIEQASGRRLGVEPEPLRALDAHGQLDYLKQKLQAAEFLPPEADARQVRGMLEVYKANQRARCSYFPQDTQPLPIALFRAVEPYADFDYGPHASEPPERSSLGWERWAAGPVAIELVPGNHLTMLFDPHVATLAARLAAHNAPLER